MFNSRLLGTLEYFSRQTKDMPYYRPTASSLGYDKIPMNIGSMRCNSGLELDLTYQIIPQQEYRLDSKRQRDLYPTTVLKLAPELNGTWIDGSRIYKEGKSMYQIYTVKYAGVDPENGNALYWARRPTAPKSMVSNWSLARKRRRSPGICREPSGESGNLPAFRLRRRIYQHQGLRIRLRHQLRIPGKAARWSTTATSCSCTAPTITMPVWPAQGYPQRMDSRKTATPTCPHSPGRAIRPYINALSPTAGSSAATIHHQQHHRRLHLPKEGCRQALLLEYPRILLRRQPSTSGASVRVSTPRQGYATSLAGSYSALRAVSGGVKN